MIFLLAIQLVLLLPDFFNINNAVSVFLRNRNVFFVLQFDKIASVLSYLNLNICNEDFTKPLTSLTTKN